MADLRSQEEKDMASELARLGVQLEAYCFRPPVSWDAPQYRYRLTWPDGDTYVGAVLLVEGRPADCFAAVLDVARRGNPRRQGAKKK